MMFPALGAISFAGCSAGLLAALVLWRIPFGERLANRVLAVLMLVVALMLLQRALSAFGVVYRFPHLQGLAGPLGFLIGPLLYFYLRLMSERTFQLRREHAWHLLPALAALLLYLPVYLSTAEEKRTFIAAYLLVPELSADSELVAIDSMIALVNLLESVGFGLSLGFYALVSLRRLDRHRQALEQNFSATERLTLSWLRNMAALACVTSAGILLAIAAAPLGQSMISSQWLPALLMVTFCFYGGYNGICQPAIYQKPQGEPILQVAAAAPVAPGKYERSGLSVEGQRLCWAQLQAYMAEHRPYLQRGLTIGQLAEAVDLPVAYLSQTINGEAGMSFFEYINRARIDAARERLRAGEPTSLATLYLDVGFNSKSSFYTQFKKFNQGMTPKQFLEVG